jgi:hypothetical protein
LLLFFLATTHLYSIINVLFYSKLNWAERKSS